MEPMVRDAFWGAVSRDLDRLESALRAIPDHSAPAAVQLCVAVDAEAAQLIFEGTPEQSDVDRLAAEFREMETWVETDGLQVEEFLNRVCGVGSTGVLSSDQAGLLPFLVGGWLLSAFTDGDEHWYERLDRILDGLDAAPIPSV